MAKKNQKAGQNIHEEVINEQAINALNQSLVIAESNLLLKTPKFNISKRLEDALTDLSRLSQKASSGFTNIVTCLAIKAARPNVDIRYHQVQIQNQTDRPAGFNFRGISEKVIYPWLSEHSFEGAKSGWQTRTFERPKPYMPSYDENIGEIKDSFLATFDEIEEHGQPADAALAFLMFLQLIHRESTKIVLSIPRTKDIQLIVNLFRDHFFYGYKTSKGASRLPVLALYAVYSVLLEQLGRYQGKELKVLEEHSAADSQTGAIGDIEVFDSQTKQVFEAIEVKHDIALNEVIITTAAKKIMDKSVDRYYILTTHSICEPNEAQSIQIEKIKTLYNCQLIANGLTPTLKYYLRLLSDPSLVFPKYVELLASDKTIGYEHREIWNQLAISG